jgi:protein-S-isoprenylcysteine O-methyltransferase Ste14
MTMDISVAGASRIPRSAKSTAESLWRLVTGRVAPAVVFLALDVPVAKLVVGDARVALHRGLSLDEMFSLIGAGLYFLFVSLMILLFLVRPPARTRDARLSSWLFAMLGTFGLLVAPTLPHGAVLFSTGTVGAMVQSVTLVIALALALVTLETLGHSFSLTPEARRLVTSGPYRLVRHPLYLCEAMTIICTTVAWCTSTMVIAMVIVLAAQVRRAQLEESILRETFPEYDDAFKGVSHFLPGLY